MNLPNKLTIARVIMIPFFLVFLMTDFFEAARYVALAIFIIASLTDMLDGKIARKYNLVTNFGKFMDPLADKLLVCSAMIAFTGMGKEPENVRKCKNLHFACSMLHFEPEFGAIIPLKYLKNPKNKLFSPTF